MNQKILVESLSMDLLRIALGLRRKSLRMAERFTEEAMKRYSELKDLNIKDKKLIELLEKMRLALESDKKDKEEDILMYSVLIQNYAIHYFN